MGDEDAAARTFFWWGFAGFIGPGEILFWIDQIVCQVRYHGNNKKVASLYVDNDNTHFNSFQVWFPPFFILVSLENITNLFRLIIEDRLFFLGETCESPFWRPTC